MASFSLQTQMNYRSNDLTAVIVGNDGQELSYYNGDDSAVAFYLVKVTDTVNVQTTIFQTVVEATNQNEESVPLGSNYSTGTDYNISVIGLDGSYNAISGDEVTDTVTFYDAPKDPSGHLFLTSETDTLIATMKLVNDLDISGASVTHFFVEAFQIGGAGSFTKTVARTPGETTVLFNGDDYGSFENGQQWSVNVTAFNEAGASGPTSETVFIEASPNTFALVITQPAVSDPSAAAFLFSATDSDPINSIDISGLTLTVTQGSHTTKLDLLAADFSGNWNDSSGVFSNLEINSSILGYTLNTSDAVDISFVAGNQFGNASAQTTFKYNNGEVNDSSFIPQAQATFVSDVTAANLAGAFVDRNVIDGSNIVTFQLSNDASLNALGSLAALYDSNSSAVVLTVEPVDVFGNPINSQEATITDLSDEIVFDLGVTSYSQIAAKLTMTSTYDNNDSDTTSITSSDVNLFTTQLQNASLTVTQPSITDTNVVATLTVEPTDTNTTGFISAVATLYIHRNNDASYGIALNDASLNTDIQVAPLTVNSIDSSNIVTFDFTNLPTLLQGTALYVSVVMTSLGSNGETYDTAAITTEDNLVYLYGYTGAGLYNGDTSYNITPNGHEINFVFSFENASGNVNLGSHWLPENPEEDVVVNNNPYNIAFDNGGDSKTYVAGQQISIVNITSGTDTLAIGVKVGNIANTSEMIVRGDSIASSNGYE